MFGRFRHVSIERERCFRSAVVLASLVLIFFVDMDEGKIAVSVVYLINFYVLYSASASVVAQFMCFLDLKCALFLRHALQ